MRGVRRSPSSTSALDRLLLRRIEACKIHIPTFSTSDAETVVDHLRSRFPEYGRFKLQPFTHRVHQILLQIRFRHQMPKRSGEAEESSKHDDDVMEESRINGASSRKRTGNRKSDGEERLVLAEEEHLRRRRKQRDSTGSPVSSSSMLCSSPEDENAVFDARFEPDFDITKVMLREKYMKLTAAGKPEERILLEIENSTEKPKRRQLDLANGKRMEEKPVVVPTSSIQGAGSLQGAKGAGAPRFKDFGGMDDVLMELKKRVIVPLRNPHLPKLFGKRPMTGILLHGPPGCGKTMLARAIANETGLPFYEIAATEVVSGISGESEGNIRDLFNKAYRTAPSIVFIDEIETIASKRENLQKEMERRMVTQLMTCMEQSRQTENKAGYVLVIGATNRPDAIDPALRRPGRFDREIALGVPDENGRKEILSVVTNKLNLHGTVDLQKIARSTPGFVGSDLEFLADMAADLAMGRIIDRMESEYLEETKENEEEEDWWRQPCTANETDILGITMDDFENAAKLVQPSLKREGFSSTPDVKWDDVGGLGHLRREFDRHIIKCIKNPGLYEKVGVQSETGFLLYGPPGCGKTLIAKAVANEAGANFIHIMGPELLNKYVGESELAVRTIFKRARTCSPCILFFDEVDSLATKRGSEGGWVVQRLLNQLLIELDGADKRHGVYVIGATNRLDVLDPAILRPGRLGNVLYVPLPNDEERVMILKAISRKNSLASDVDLDVIGRSEACKNLSGADLYLVIQRAAMAAVDEELTVINASHFEHVLKDISPSVSEKVHLIGL